MSKQSSIALLHKDFNLNQFIKNALQEDIREGDFTSLSTIPPKAKNKANLIIKDNGVLAGMELAKRIFHTIDKNLKLKVYINDGSKIRKGDIVFTVAGNARAILTAERLVLNCMQRMSGIATLTNQFTLLCKPSHTKILDTRKTTPCIRGLEKWAVRIGGGHNHRFGLYDMILIKNNHIDFAGGIRPAIESANKFLQKNKLNLKIEIEARNLLEVNEIITIGNIDRILLDNFTPKKIKHAVSVINKRFETEISGGINKKNIHKYAACGADYISAGAITHSAKSIDMSLTAV